jgi:DNA-binding transcriptional LysR family regulator
MKYGLLSDLDVAPLPFRSNPVNLFLVWHQREDDDPAHKWFRQKIIETAHSIFNG